VWEQTDQRAIAAGFKVREKVDTLDRYDAGNGIPTVGYNYEETICRAQERAINEAIYDGQDWSHDPTGHYEGKMWKALP
jgi:tryptophan synthase alpha subunit